MFVDDVYRDAVEIKLVGSRAEFSQKFLGQAETYYDDCVAGGFEPGPAAYAFLFVRLMEVGRLIRDQQALDPAASLFTKYASDVERQLVKCGNRLNGRTDDYPWDVLDNDPLPPELAL